MGGKESSLKVNLKTLKSIALTYLFLNFVFRIKHGALTVALTAEIA